MTFKEKLAEGRCPSDFGYEKDNPCQKTTIECNECWNREMPDTPAPMTEEEVWELVNKIYEFPCDKHEAIFGEQHSFYEVISELTIHEVKAKLDKWESKQIQVGDVVKSGLIKGVVTAKYPADNNSEAINILRYNGLFAMNQDIKGWKKTGKHIDIQSVLDQIGGGNHD